MQYVFCYFHLPFKVWMGVAFTPTKTRPTTWVVFNRILPIRKTSTTWPSEFANSALTDWVGLFSHHDNGISPINVNNRNSVGHTLWGKPTSLNRSNLMVVGSSQVLTPLRPCNIPMSWFYISLWLASSFLINSPYSLRVINLASNICLMSFAFSSIVIFSVSF